MDRLTGNEYCCAISPPAAPEFCLHMALFYRRCNRAGTPIRTSSATVLASPPDTPPAERPPPQPQGCCRAVLPSQGPRLSRYAVYRLVYEMRHSPPAAATGGRGQLAPPPLHRLFVEKGFVGPVRGLCLDLIGSPATGMRYSETPGDDPERAAAAPVISLPPPFPPTSSSPSLSGASSSASAPAASPALQTKTLVGTIAAEDLDRLRDICRRGPPPPRPLAGPRHLAPLMPVRRSQDWVHESIVRSIAEGVLDVGRASR